RHVYNEMSHFFSVYKSLEKKETAVDEVLDEAEAKKIIQRAIDRYKVKFPKEEKQQ
ncbi:MAG: inorganic diphosphatase, partial [Oscillospiraceae bacterium]|nr:inorganic diphosphatase [Oscillospiraceae bacterium]